MDVTFTTAPKASLVPEVPLYLILDGAAAAEGFASVAAMIYSLEPAPDAHPLLAGHVEDEVMLVGPWLVRIKPDSALLTHLTERPMRYPFLVLQTVLTPDLLKAQLLNLFCARSSTGETQLFRFFDSRVFGPLVPQVSEPVLQRWLGPCRLLMVPPWRHEKSLDQESRWQVSTFKPTSSDFQPSPVHLSEHAEAALRQIQFRRDLQAIIVRLWAEYPQQADKLEEQDRRAFLKTCLGRGEALGLSTFDEYSQWLELCWHLGPEFTTNSHYPWASTSAADPQLTPAAKLEHWNLHLDMLLARSAS